MKTEFFLGANTPGGFAGYFNEWLDYGKLKRLYIIKGTPGNGKSGFMRRVITKLGARAGDYEAICCSADPTSLDGVYFPKLGTAFADGTLPHVIEPKYPLAVECYLPLTQFVNDTALLCERESVIALKDSLGADYARLRRILSAAHSLREERRALVSTPEVLQTIQRRANGFIRREIKRGKDGRLHKRFLHALTPDGVVTLWHTVDAMADRVYELRDSYHLANAFLHPIMEAAAERGVEVYACYDPFEPEGHISHLLLPGLRLAVVSAKYPGSGTGTGAPFRRLRLDSAIPGEITKNRRLRLRFLKKTQDSLLEDGCRVLGGAVETHSRLEDIYNPHVDFPCVRALADAYADKLLA